MPPEASDQPGGGRIVEIVLDDALLSGNSPEHEHERKVAIADILEHNSFSFGDISEQSYRLKLSVVEKRLMIRVSNEADNPIGEHALPLTPFSRLIKDYFLVCESYYEAIRSAPPARIEALDHERRRLHDEGSNLLIERLENKIRIDFDTARRLFTLICALHWKGHKA